MKQVSQAEFEMLVRSLIEKKTTRRELAKNLETDMRTLNNKIRELSEKDFKLYEEYIKKFPYKPKTREDINYEALVMQVMKKGVSLDIMQEQYGVSIRTISRRIKVMEKTNPQLIEMYREYANCLKRAKKLPYELQVKIDALPEEPVVLSEITQKKEKELREIIQKFEELVNKGMSKAKAARILGYDGYPTIWKKQQELERIETEKNAKKYIADDAPRNFRQSIRLDSLELDIRKMSKADANTKSKELEGR